MSIGNATKDVIVWSVRQRRPLGVRVEYQKLKVGDFTLIQLSRVRDTEGHDSAQHSPITKTQAS